MASTEQDPDVAYQGLLAHKGKTLTAPSLMLKHQRHRLNIHIQADRCLKQAGMKRSHLPPRGGGAFGKQAYRVAPFETNRQQSEWPDVGHVQ